MNSKGKNHNDPGSKKARFENTWQDFAANSDTQNR